MVCVVVPYGAGYIGYEPRWLVDRFNIPVTVELLELLHEVTNLFDLLLVVLALICSRSKSIEEILAEGDNLLENDISADHAEGDGGGRRDNGGLNRLIDPSQCLKGERFLRGSGDSVKEGCSVIERRGRAFGRRVSSRSERSR